MQTVFIFLFSLYAALLLCGLILSIIFFTENGKADRAMVSAEDGNRTRNLLISRINREIRAPMNAIIGMTCMGKASVDIERKDYCLDNIETTSRNMLGVVNDMLDICKIESNKLELTYSNFNMDKMLAKILSAFSGIVEEKKLKLILSAEQDVPEMLYTDEQRLGQVITSLLNNAIGSTPGGGTIYLFVRKPAHSGDVFTLQFEVRDTGAGMTAERQSKLFSLSEQLDDCILRKNDNGLSLAVSKRLVELLGGNMSVKSVPGQGSSFVFDICSGITQTIAQEAPDARRGGISFNLLSRMGRHAVHPHGRGKLSPLQFHLRDR